MTFPDPGLPRMTLRPPIPLVLQRLARRIRTSGGDVLPDACHSTEIPAVVSKDGARVRLEPAYTTGCGGETRVVIPYDAYDWQHKVWDDTKGYDVPRQHTGFATACAVDDAVYLWPRYADQWAEPDAQQPETD